MNALPPLTAGSVNGRFQGLHLGHEEYILAAKQRCDYLYIGLAMPDPNDRSGKVVDAHRHDLRNNPFSFHERAELIRACLLGAGHSDSEFTVRPFPIDDLAGVSNYLPDRSEVRLFVTIYDSWGEHKAREEEVV